MENLERMLLGIARALGCCGVLRAVEFSETRPAAKRLSECATEALTRGGCYGDVVCMLLGIFACCGVL